MEFVFYLNRLLDTTNVYHQQKHSYWMNLEQFACPPGEKVGDDVPPTVLRKLDHLFGKLQQEIRRVEIAALHQDLVESELYERFIRHASAGLRHELSKSKLTRLDLLSVQKRLDAMPVLDATHKQFYDLWILPRLAPQPAVVSSGRAHRTAFTHHRQRLRKTFGFIRSRITSVGTLARVQWLISRQWNFLIVELSQRLESSQQS
jgi:hypothetical protein